MPEASGGFFSAENHACIGASRGRMQSNGDAAISWRIDTDGAILPAGSGTPSGGFFFAVQCPFLCMATLQQQ